MKSLLTQLERNEMLLMYVTGELPPQDQMHVQQMLEQDEALRAEMEKLRGMLQGVEGVLAGSAGAGVDDISAQRATEKTILAMRSHRAEMRREDSAGKQKQGWRMPGWAYPVAAAAILLIAFSIYLQNMDRPSQHMENDQVAAAVASDLAKSLVGPMPDDALATDETADNLAATFDDSDWVLTEANDLGGLTGAMEELRVIERLSGEPVESDSVQ